MTGMAVGIIRSIAKYYHESDLVALTRRLSAMNEASVQINVNPGIDKKTATRPFFQ